MNHSSLSDLMIMLLWATLINVLISFVGVVSDELSLLGFPTTYLNSSLIYFFLFLFSLPRCLKDPSPVSNWIYLLIGLIDAISVIFLQLAFQNTSIASKDLMMSFSVLTAAVLSILIF